MNEIGIHCTNPEALQERLIVWDGLELTSRAEADSASAVFDDVPLVLPRGMPRAASMEETLEIIATPDTKRVMQLCRLPRSVGELLVRQCQEAPQFRQDQPYAQLTEHISGRYVSWRDDPAEQLTVTQRNGTDKRIATPAKAGFHIDTWKDEAFNLAIINAGPGERWHCIVPGYTRSVIGGAGRQDRINYFEQHTDNLAKVFGIRLDPPTTHHEAIIGSPVAHVLHDGSTITANEGSTAVFINMAEVATDAYPSPLC